MSNQETGSVPAWADMTIAEACDYMRLSRAKVVQLVKDGVLVSYALSAGRRAGRRIRRDSIEALRNGRPLAVFQTADSDSLGKRPVSRKQVDGSGNDPRQY